MCQCRKATDHEELTQFYNLSKNLVILFDRGEDFTEKTKVDFSEDFYLDGRYVENFQNLSINYKLTSIICRIEEENVNTKRMQEKFITFKKSNNYNNAYYISSWIIKI